jgi:twitching motility protein PilT
MAHIDKLLHQIVVKKGLRLVVEPLKPPFLVTHGAEIPILHEPIPSAMVDALISQIMPDHLKKTWDEDAKATFDHATEMSTFNIKVERESKGIRITAEPYRHGMAGAPVPAPTTPDLEPVVGPTVIMDTERESGRSTTFEASTGGARTLADDLLRALLEKGGSDLHCSSFEVPIIRVNGELQELSDQHVLGPNQLETLMESIAPPHVWAKFQETNDADFAYTYEEGGCRLRVNFFRDRVGPGFVSRVIPDKIPDASALGLSENIRKLAMLSKGLVLVTGPTGSGKSTTLAAIIDIANRQRSDHILTIEDPIEFVHPRKKCLINQREVKTHTDSFKSGLRAALREDPDIVLVGEMRDLETIAIALETAITGHLVFGTLHTSSAIGTIDRIVDQFPSDRQQQIRVMLADALKCVISQVLIKKKSGGRVAAIESLFITPAIANLIREGKNYQITSAMQAGRANGQRLMNDALVELIQAKQITAEDAFLKCPDSETFLASLKRANIEINIPGVG